MAEDYKIAQHAGLDEWKRGVLARPNNKPWRYIDRIPNPYGWMNRREYKQVRKLAKKKFSANPEVRRLFMQNILGMTDEEYIAARRYL